MTMAGPKVPRTGSSAGGVRPPGALAWREYEIDLHTGHPLKLGFMLADPTQRGTAQLKRTYKAQHLGMLVLDGQRLHCIVWWFQQEDALTLIPRHGDSEIDDDLKEILPRYFAAFFDDIKDVAPDLQKVTLVTPKTGDRRLH